MTYGTVGKGDKEGYDATGKGGTRTKKRSKSATREVGSRGVAVRQNVTCERLARCGRHRQKRRNKHTGTD